MLIRGTSNTDKTILLARKYVELINSGTSPENILVILLNSYKKVCFIDEVRKINKDILCERNKIYTFFGLCYNSVNDNWGYISSKINNASNETPNLCGLEVSQYIFKQSIKQADFSDYISKVNLLHQLFRRYSLIVQNKLTNVEILKRSQLLGETFAIDAQKAIEEYKKRTIQYMSFDYLRQLAILPEIVKNTQYFSNVKFLLVDDADEQSYAFWNFIDDIVPDLQDFVIAYDANGSTRCGYLCAYKNGIKYFKDRYNPSEICLEDKSVYYEFSEEFSNNIRKSRKTKVDNFYFRNLVKRLDMIESVLVDISELLKNGVNPSDIVLISPICDEILCSGLNDNDKNIKFMLLSGNEKLVQDNTVKFVISVLKLSLGIKLKEYELKNLLIRLLSIPYKYCHRIIKEYLEHNSFINIDFINEHYDYAYKKFVSLVKSIVKSDDCVSEKVKIIYQNLLKEFDKNLNLEKYDFLMKEAKSFEYAFSGRVENLSVEFITQIENSVISENPADSISLKKDCILIATPQKLVDCSIKSKYQFWLDISSNEWVKEDTGTLYNAWVFSKDWEKETYTLEDNISLTLDKTARMVRKLVLCSSNEIRFYSSLYDNTGNENFGGLTEFITKDETVKKEFNIIPRADQKPVLDYKKGKLGIMAVPGAGKTTILLALIIKLIKDGTPPQNIFVLTYMESAAKNFKERIKIALPDSLEMPSISTIHGLALRIIKENSNYSKVGLDSNFEICDDTTKERIVKEILYSLKIEDEKFDNYIKCISIVKLSNRKGEMYSPHKELRDFYRFFEEYNVYLKRNNLLDYDDMLCFSVQILEKNPDILRYYQNICKYIIEDEAQDSTDIQQRLLLLLSGKYNNIVRCGDINQSITSTFTNSNIDSFKNFLHQNQKVEMNSSQRCAEPIYTFANKLIENSLKDEEKKFAFYKIQMKGTGNNPISSFVPDFKIFDSEDEEKVFILQKINEIFAKSPNASVAVLLRLNAQVNEYNEFLIKNGIKTSIRTDSLEQKKIYKIIKYVLDIVDNPILNKNVINLIQYYKEEKLCNVSATDIDFIKNLKSPFLNLNLEELNSEVLMQIHCDINYWLNESINDVENLVVKIGLFYSKNSVDKSNVHLISTIIKRLKESNDSFSDVLRKFDYIAQKSLSAYKFFDEDVKEGQSQIHIMTMHKSKGDEFDYVFIPKLNEDNYPLAKENVKLKSGGHFVQTVKSNIECSMLKTPEILKQEQIYETLRLLYVGFTRAKLGLYLSSANKNKRNKNIKISDFLFGLM